MVAPTGGRIVAQTLAELGVGTIFSVSGNQILTIYDAIQDLDIRLIHTRHETAAAYAATASAELRDRPGVVLVSAGPGFLATLHGIAAAKSMELPVLFLSGASPLVQRGAGAFQDLDQQQVAGAICKAAVQVTSVDQIRPLLTRAWQLAREGIPGPVHVSLPIDMLTAEADATSPARQESTEEPVTDRMTDEARSTLDKMARLLMTSSRPLIIGRPAAARFDTGRALRQLAGKLGIEPIVTESPRGFQDLKYHNLVSHLPDSDCALVIAPTDFAVAFLSETAVAHDGDILLIDSPDDPEPSRTPRFHLQLDPAIAISYLADRVSESRTVDADWSELWKPADSGLTAQSEAGEWLHPLELAPIIREQIGPDDTVVMDGGEFCQWMRLGLSGIANQILWNGKIGAIGGSIPMALGVAAMKSTGRVIVLLGDGSAGYHLSEFETARRYELPLTAIIGNDTRWAAEWHMQVNRFGNNRAFETDLLDVPYERAAEGFGGIGHAVQDIGSFRSRFVESLETPLPVCLNVRIQSIQSPAAIE